jgi:hypothetical protein
LVFVVLATLWGCDVQHELGMIVLDDGGTVDTTGLYTNQSWTGRVENYQWTSGSNAIKILIAHDSAGAIVGQAILGDATPPPPATDPNVGYPPDFPLEIDYINLYWVEGFAYSIFNGVSSPFRLRFTLENYEFWAGWCALQTPADNGGLCLPNWAGSSIGGQCSETSPTGGQSTSVDCAKYSLCVLSRVCACAATTCEVDPSVGGTISFDLAISGGTASGTTSGLINGFNVYLTQDP